jgi:hypothetical protein
MLTERPSPLPPPIRRLPPGLTSHIEDTQIGDRTHEQDEVKVLFMKHYAAVAAEEDPDLRGT